MTTVDKREKLFNVLNKIPFVKRYAFRLATWVHSIDYTSWDTFKTAFIDKEEKK